MTQRVCDVGEKKLINYILSKSADITPDDCAVTEFNDLKLISTTDMLIQHKHFPKNMSYYQMGYKAVTVNVSDIAAMGGKPLGFLLAIAVPKTLKVKYFKQIIKGVIKACKYYNIPLIGGDTNEADEIIITGTALASCDNPLMKNKYTEGDLIAVTGTLGLAALGFNLKGLNKYTEKSLKPVARLKEGIAIKNAGATAATDITDGLASELYEMKKDGYGFMIYEDSLNITDEFKTLATNYLDLVLHVGEDFELIFMISKKNIEKLNIDYYVIGEVNKSDKVEITLANGKVKKIENRGYNHYVS